MTSSFPGLSLLLLRHQTQQHGTGGGATDQRQGANGRSAAKALRLDGL